MPTNSSISGEMGVISPDFCRQHEDASLLLLAHHETFLAGFVCLCKAQQCHSPGPHPAPPQHFIFCYSMSWLAEAVKVKTSWCKKLSLTWARASAPCLHCTEIPDLFLGFSPLSHRSSEIIFFGQFNNFLRHKFILNSITTFSKCTLCSKASATALSHLLLFLTHFGNKCFTFSKCQYTERKWCFLANNTPIF